MAALTEDVIQTIQSAAKLLTGHKRRRFQAETALKYCNGSARQAEKVFGWGRAAVDTGLNELRTGVRQHWNGTLLHSVETALRWAGTMTWRTIHPLIREITTTYERGVRLTKTAFRPIAERLIRSETSAQMVPHHSARMTGRIINTPLPNRLRPARSLQNRQSLCGVSSKRTQGQQVQVAFQAKPGGIGIAGLLIGLSQVQIGGAEMKIAAKGLLECRDRLTGSGVEHAKPRRLNCRASRGIRRSAGPLTFARNPCGRGRTTSGPRARPGKGCSGWALDPACQAAPFPPRQSCPVAIIRCPAPNRDQSALPRTPARRGIVGQQQRPAFRLMLEIVKRQPAAGIVLLISIGSGRQEERIEGKAESAIIGGGRFIHAGQGAFVEVPFARALAAQEFALDRAEDQDQAAALRAVPRQGRNLLS